MNQIVSDKPVFIDQMPDYQQAVRQVVLLSKDESRFRAVAGELGLGGDVDGLAGSVAGFKAQAQAIVAEARNLDERNAQINGRALHAAQTAVITGSAAVLGGGIGSGIVAVKRWGGFKGTLTGIASAAAIGGAWIAGTLAVLSRHVKDSRELHAEGDALRMQKEQLVQQQMELGGQFAGKMATRMLEQQKMLVGDSPGEMTLVSTAAPKAVTQSASMAVKYAQGPAASHAETVALSGAITLQR